MWPLRVAGAGCALALAACSLTGGGSSSTTGGGGVATRPSVGGSPSGSATASASPGITQAGGSRTVIAPLGLNLRTAPSTTASLLGTLGQGASVTVLAHTDENGGWYQVKAATQTGWISDNPQFSSSRHFESFSSLAHGFAALYPDTWTFSETSTGVAFKPQSGPQVIEVTTAATLDAIGAPGRTGYTLTATDSVEVYGITGVLRSYERSTATATAATTSPAAGAPLNHLAEIRLVIDKTHAMRITFDYLAAVDLDIFRDVYNSIVLVLTATPTPTR